MWLSGNGQASGCRGRSGLFDGVVAAGAKWMAAQKPAQGEEKAARNPVPIKGDEGVLRTGGRITAGRREERGDEKLIKADEGNA